MITRYVVGGVLAIVVIYGLIEARPLITGPTISLAAPREGEATSSPITVSGVATRTVSLTLDGAPLLPDQAGHFLSTLALPRGAAILTLMARDRFGRRVTLTRTILVQ